MIREEIELVLAGETYKLTPTVAALERIDARFGSLIECSRRIEGYSLEAISLVIAAGAGLSAKQTPAMREKLLSAGLKAAIQPLTRYLAAFLDGDGGGDASGEA